MKQLIYKVPLSLILFAGLIVGIAKGQDVRQKWVSKMKNRQESEKNRVAPGSTEVMLDEIEMATYHS